MLEVIGKEDVSERTIQLISETDSQLTTLLRHLIKSINPSSNFFTTVPYSSSVMPTTDVLIAESGQVESTLKKSNQDFIDKLKYIIILGSIEEDFVGNLERDYQIEGKVSTASIPDENELRDFEHPDAEETLHNIPKICSILAQALINY